MSLHEAFVSLAEGLDTRARRDSNIARRAILRETATRIRSVLEEFPELVTFTEYAYRAPDGTIHPSEAIPPEGRQLLIRTVTAWREV